MVDRNANIDFLFRNGLKDFEVLPPVDSWNKIRPVIRKKQMPFIIFRNAAAIAGLVSVSLLAYMLNREVNSSFRDQFIAVEQGSVRTPELLTVQDVPGRIAAANIQPQARQSHLIADRPDQTVNGETENVVSSAGGNVPETRTLNIYRGIRALSGLSGRKAAGYNSDEATLYGEGEFTDYSFDTPKEKINRWSIAAMASPTYFPRPQMGNDEIARQMMSAEQSRVSYSGGVSFAYNISKKLSIQSGIYYSSVGQEVGGISSFSGFRQYDMTKGDHNFEVLTSSGSILTSNSDIFLLDRAGDRVLTRYTRDVFDPAKASLPYINNSLRQSFSYLEMPVILRYKLIDRSIDFNVIGGLSYNMLVNNNVYTMIDGGKYSVGETAGLSHFMVSSSLGMGMEYNLSDKFSLNLEPTFRYYLNPFGEMGGMKGRPYSIGIFSGLSYKF